MKAALLVSSALLAIASASASARSITKVENGALVAANGMTAIRPGSPTPAPAPARANANPSGRPYKAGRIALPPSGRRTTMQPGGASAIRREAEHGAFAHAGRRPALRDRLALRVEAHGVRPYVQVAEQRTLPAAERVVRKHRQRQR